MSDPSRVVVRVLAVLFYSVQGNKTYHATSASASVSSSTYDIEEFSLEAASYLRRDINLAQSP